MMRLLKYFLPFLLGVISAQANISLVKLDSGEQLLGEVLPQSNDAVLVLRSNLLGEVELPRSRVLVIEAREPEAKAEAEPEAGVARAEQASEPKTKKPQVALKEADAEAPSEGQSAAAPKPDAPESQSAEEKRREIVKSLRELKAPEIWSGNLRLGINLSSGDQRWTETYARGKLEIKPKQSPHFYRFAGAYTYRQTERNNGDTFKSTDRYDAEFTYRRNFGEGAWFFQNALGGRVDQIKGIEHEIQDTVGIGYRYKPSNSLEVLLGGGGGVEDLEVNFEDTRSGFNSVMNIFQETTWRPMKRTSLVQRFNYYWNPEEPDQFNYVLTTAVRVRLTDLLGFEFSFNKNFDNDVGDGNARDDTQWRNALVVYF